MEDDPILSTQKFQNNADQMYSIVQPLPRKLCYSTDSLMTLRMYHLTSMRIVICSCYCIKDSIQWQKWNEFLIMWDYYGCRMYNIHGIYPGTDQAHIPLAMDRQAMSMLINLHWWHQMNNFNLNFIHVLQKHVPPSTDPPSTSLLWEQHKNWFLVDWLKFIQSAKEDKNWW